MADIKIKLGELRALVRETLGEPALNESEIYVDERGYAHDDEGNTWFVGNKGGGGLYKASSYIDRFGPPRNSTSTRRTGPTPASASPGTKEVLDAILAKKPTDSFVISVKDQVARGRALSPKQKDVVLKILQRMGMADMAAKLG